MRRAWGLAAAALLLACSTASLAAQVAVPVRDTSATVVRPDTAVKRADTTAAAAATRDTSVTAGARDTTAIVTAKHDSTVVITTRATPAKKGAKAAPEPPYRIEADHMTGGRGPTGDVLFLEKVTITRTRTRLQSDRGRYERATGMVYLEGNVKLRDSSTTATCDEAQFSEHEDRLDLRGNVVVTDRDATLKAPQGWYDRKNGIAQLTGGVRGQEKQQRLVADEAFYQRDSMIVKARGHVIGNDDENKIQLEAKSVDFDRRNKIAVATGEPLMRAKDGDGKETIMRARLLKVNSETKIAEAIDSVRVERDTLQASARYARFDDNTGRGVLVGNPKAWDNETQVTGDTLETIAVKRKLERVIVRGSAVLDYKGARDTNKGETSRLTGSQVDMFVGESTIDSLVATGKAHNEYTAAPQKGKTAENNMTQGDTIFVYFKDKKIDRARVQGGATGTYRAPVAVSDTTSQRLERVDYDSRRIEFVIPKNTIVLDGDAHLSYRDLELHSRRVEFDSQKNTLVAEGKPQIVEKGEELNGQLMTYDLDRKVGTVYQATTEYERGLYHGKEIRKANDNELDVLGGAYSTCDLDSPHYHFASHYMKIYLKDKMVAKPLIFYVRNVPILALPFWVFPIKPGRHSGFLFPQVEFGFNTTTGQFVRNGGYYWAPNDYFDITGAGDYYEGTSSTPAGWAARGELNYKLLYAFDGHMEGRFDRSSDVIGSQHENYQFYGTHQQTLGERTRISAIGNFVSSRDYSKSAFAYGTSDINSRLNRFLTSSIQLSHYADWISLNAVVDRRQDLDASQTLEDPDGAGPLHGPAVGTNASLPSLTVTYPSLSASLPTRALGSYQFMKDNALGKALASTYMTLSGRFLAVETRTGIVTGQAYSRDTTGTIIDSTNVVGESVNRRWGQASTFALSDSRRLLGWINFSPSIFGNAVIFDHDVLGNKVVPAATWQASAGLGTTLYRTMKMPFPGVAMRHILSPSANVVYSPEFPGLTYVDSNGVRHERFDPIGDIAISGAKAARMNFSIDQRFQAKVGSGEHVRRLDNLLSWTTSSSYDFLWRDNPNLKHGLGAILSGMRLQPPGWVNGDASVTIDAYSGRPLRSFNYNLSSSFNSSGSGKPQSPRIATGPLPSRGYNVESQEPEEFRETWSAALSYSYAGGYFTTSPNWSTNKTLNGVLRYVLTDNWTFDYQAGYDLTKHEMLLQRFNLTRRIHCWEATFSRSFLPGGEIEYFFHLGIREQKEVYYERGTRGQTFPGYPGL